MDNKIKSVYELARYKPGDIVYWLYLKQESAEATDTEIWMIDHHPKVLYSGPSKKIWKSTAGRSGAKLPKLHHTDFNNIINLLTAKMCIELFDIKYINRSRDTGEFHYINRDEVWMPESCLFDSLAAARIEKNRILKLLNEWVKRNL